MEAQLLIRLTPRAVDAIEEAAVRAGPGLPLESVHLVVAALAGGAGRQVLDILAPGRVPDVEAALRARPAPRGDAVGELELPGGRTVGVGASARPVFDALAGRMGRTAGTADVIATEGGRPGSDLATVLTDLGLGGPPDALPGQLEALAERTAADGGAPRSVLYRPGPAPAEFGAPDGTEETGGNFASPSDRYGPVAAVRPPTGGGPAGSPGQPAPPADAPGEALRPQDAARQPSATAHNRGAGAAPPPRDRWWTDLLASAQTRSPTSAALAVNPDVLRRVLSAVDRNSLTVLVTDSAEAAEALAAALAGQLASDTGNLFRIGSVIQMEPGHRATDPVRALREALKAAAGGLLYLPDVDRFLDPTRPDGTSAELRAALAREELRVLGTLEDRALGKWPPADAPAHELVFLEPSGIGETVALLTERRDDLAREVSGPGLAVEITDEAIAAAARLADRYYRDPPPPGGALRLLKEAATAIKVGASDGMAALRDPRVKSTPSLDEDDVNFALERLTGIKAALDETEKLLGMDDALRRRVVGQDHAIAAVSDAVRRARAGLKDPTRPIGSFLFLGPSGVGKTELAKALAEFLFDDDRAMVRLDMSEFQERHTVSRLLGAPPGYVGYDQGGQLTEPVRRKPYQLVLFDEIEKAHPDIHNVLLQIMDDGRLTDARGRTVDFRHTLVIMTGNVGSEYFRVEDEVGRDKVEEAVREEARHVFRPEFLGRLDELIIFNSLGREEMRKIVDIQERKLARKLEDRNVTIQFSDAVKDLLADKGYAPELGARPLRNEIQNRVERPLSRAIIEGKVVPGEAVIADLDAEGEVVFRTAPA